MVWIWNSKSVEHERICKICSMNELPGIQGYEVDADTIYKQTWTGREIW